MSARSIPRINKSPFFVADVALLGVAVWIVWKSPGPLAAVPLAMVVTAIIAGFAFAIVPFILEYQALVKFAEGDNLVDTISQIGRVEMAAEQIRLATSLWQGVQDQSAKTAAAAKEIAGRMSDEARAFAEFMQKANDTEKATLRLEVEKLRRAESDWLQVVVRVLDHTFALNQAAIRSGQTNVIEQLDRFQTACRDVARRIGLMPFEAAPGETFDPKKHQPIEASEVPEGATRIAETVAAGFTYQGQPLRRALVRLETDTEIESSAAAAATEPPGQEPTSQDELELPINPGTELG